MSEIKANIVVQPVQSTFAVTDNTVTFTPSDIQLNVYSSGRQGPLGYTGSQGPPNGYTGSRGTAGAPGPTGPQGPPNGYTGSRGIQGIPGAVGNPGPPGVDGYTGSQGDLGYTGSRGAGYTGSASTVVGPQGPIGYSGSEGPQGPQGIQGDLGYTGSIGPQGPIGYTGSTTVNTYIQNGTSIAYLDSPNGNFQIDIAGVYKAIISAGYSSFDNLTLVRYKETVVNGGTVSGTLTPNAANGTIYKYTLNGNITLNSLANAVAGTNMVIILTQDAVGSRTLTSTMKFAGASKTLSTAANQTDVITVFYDGTTYWAALSKGYN